MGLIYDLLKEVLERLLDVQQRSARIETRLCKLADGLHVTVRKEGMAIELKKGDWK